jgi:ribokinase
MDFIAIGDTAVDEFIQLKDARVTCDVNDANCTITMKWADKIPFEFATIVAGVGNAANAAVAAARLGLSSAFVSNVGKDQYGADIMSAFQKEGIDTRYMQVHEGLPTNHHYVLMYEAERTILVHHEQYPYEIPANFVAPKWIYLSSLGDNSEQFHHDLAAWLRANPDTKLAFQPGTFQMTMGKEVLKDLYAATEVLACNKEEAERILGVPPTDIKELLSKMRELGPKISLITDGKKGSYVSNGSESYHVPMYPDPRPPVDRTGAGDATSSTFVVALALGKTLAEALLWGPVNASSVVQYIGAQKGLLSRDQLEQTLRAAGTSYAAEPL